MPCFQMGLIKDENYFKRTDYEEMEKEIFKNEI